MIITKTPLRISFAGGGSDCPWFYEKEIGAVVSTTIDKFLYIAVQPTFDGKYRLHYSKAEETERVKDIKNDLVREIITCFPVNPIEIVSLADIPGGTGLGSSSAYAVGLFSAMFKTDNKEWLAEMSSEIEINQMHKPIGKQDQYACSYGGFNLIEFKRGEVRVTPIKFDYKKLENNLLLFYTGKTRKAEAIHHDILNNITPKKRKLQRKMVELAYDLKAGLESGYFEQVGSILHEGWMLKKQMSNQISNSKIDKWHDMALNAGAQGGKLLGAGGGGFLLFYAPKERHEQIIKALPLRKVDFKFSNKGSEVICI